jgi:extracellular elastinolytic metalloproteinase
LFSSPPRASADAHPVLSARDAIIQADATRYAGANKCTLWRAFASKGLGPNAKSHNDDTTVPSGC